jgi:hypothetical protein
MTKGKYFFKVFIITFFLVFNISGAENIIKNEKEKKLYGYWTPYFPAWATAGYVFNIDGSFYFSDAPARKEKCSGYIGRWKLEGNNIMILVNYKIVWQKEWVVSKIKGYHEGDGNEAILINEENPQWILIGYLNTIESIKERNLPNGDVKIFPYSLVLKTFLNNNFESGKKFFKLCTFTINTVSDETSCNAAITIKDSINNLKKNK